MAPVERDAPRAHQLQFALEADAVQRESGRKIEIYALTKAGRKHLSKEEAAWQHATGIVARFFKIQDERS